MKLDDVPLYCREALAVLGIFQHLGVTSDDIYFMPKLTGGVWCPAIVARLAGRLTPGWHVSIFGGTPTAEQLVQEWQTAVTLWNNLSQGDRRRAVDSSKSRKVAVPFLALCAEKGITFTKERIEAVTSNVQ